MKKKKNNKVEKVFSAEGIVLLGAVSLLIPFMYLHTSLDPVLYPRLAAWSGACVIMGLTGYAISRKQKWVHLNLKHPWVFILSGFVIWSFVALTWAGNPVEGLTDVFKWLTFLFFTIISTLFLTRNPATFDLVVKGIVGYSLFTCMYGILQFFEFVPMQSDVNAVYEVKGLMAHKNQLSIALYLFFPFLFYAWNRFESRWKKAALTAMVADLLLILMLGTRAVWLALIFSGLCLLLLFVLLQKHSAREVSYRIWMLRFLRVAGILVILIVLSFWLLPEGFLFDRIASRFFSILDPEFTSNKWRTEMWQATFHLFRDHPLLGVGTGNWKIEVYPYYSEFQPSVFRHWRNPHNDYLLVAAEKGIVGVLFFVTLYIIPAIIALMLARKAERGSDRMTFLVVSVFIFGYMFVSFFSFPGERIHHFVFLGILIAFIMTEQLKRGTRVQPSVPRLLLLFFPLVFILPVFYFSVRTVQAEIHLKEAFAAQEAERWNAMVKSVEKAQFRWAPLEPRRSCPLEFYKGYALYRKKRYSEALRIFLQSYNLNPNNQLITNNLGSVYGQLAKFDSAVFFFNRSIELLPRYEVGLINLSKVYYLRDENEKAYQTILACDPKSKNQEIGQISNMLKKRLNQ